MEAYNLIDLIGRTPLVKVFSDQGSVVLAKLEGNNPGGSIKDRPALGYYYRGN